MDTRTCRIVTDDLFHIGTRVRDLDPWLVLVLNSYNNRYEVHDTHPNVHPRHTLLLRVMTLQGEFRIPDSRDLNTLREMRSKTPEQVYKEIEDYEEARLRKWDAESTRLGLSLADDIRWAGRAITSSVAARARGALWLPRRDIAWRSAR